MRFLYIQCEGEHSYFRDDNIKQEDCTPDDVTVTFLDGTEPMEFKDVLSHNTEDVDTLHIRTEKKTTTIRASVLTTVLVSFPTEAHRRNENYASKVHLTFTDGTEQEIDGVEYNWT